MSHLTKVKTCFQNVSYLQKALVKLEIPNFKNNKSTNSPTNNLLLLSEDKNPVYHHNDLAFNWDGKAFALNVDSDYWNQEYSVNHFLTRIKKEYATETIVGESQKFGFKPIRIKQHSDGSRVISLQRYNPII